MKNDEYLLLKWGTLKGWNIGENKKAKSIFEKLIEEGLSYSAMAQNRTEKHKELICDLIDSINGPIENDWTGETYKTKEDAKKYIIEYDNK